jgi:hypothetical protein
VSSTQATTAPNDEPNSPKTVGEKSASKANGKVNGKSNGHDANAEATVPVSAPIEPMSSADPFAASNFAAEGEQVPTGIDDMQIQIGAPSDEEFVFVSSDPRHYLKGNLLVVAREDGYGKSYFICAPNVTQFLKAQPSLKKFVKTYNIYLYVTSEGAYGLWLVRDSFDNWSLSDLQVVSQAKKSFTRRYNDGKVRKGHSSTAIPTEGVSFPDKALVGSDGLLKQAFGEAFAISTTNHQVIKRLLGQ